MARKASIVSLRKALTERRAQMRDMRNTLALVEKHKDEFNVALATANAILAAGHCEFRWTGADCRAYEGWNGTTLTANVNVGVMVDELKTGPVPAMLEAALAYELDVREHDYAGETYASRTYTVTGPIGRVYVRISIDAALANPDGETCRRVQVGTELKEVPKFAIICE